LKHSYLDPIHNAEVTPTGLIGALFDAASEEMERLKCIRNLGIISYVRPTAYHTKFDHHIGVVYLVQQALSIPKKEGGPFPKERDDTPRNAIEFVAALSHIGHMPFTYACERALIAAAAYSPDVREKLEQHIACLDDRVGPCELCGRSDVCEAQDWQPTEVLKSIIEGDRVRGWRDLYRLFSAVKALENSELHSILINNSEQPQPSLVQIALNIMANRNCHFFKQLLRLDKLDYVLRDLTYTGTAQLQCNTNSLVRNLSDPMWDVVRHMETHYLKPEVYESRECAVRSALLTKSLAAEFVKSPGLFIDFLEPDSDRGSKVCTDEKVRKTYEKRKAFQGLFEPGEGPFTQVWEIPCLKQADATDIEQEITSYRKGIFQYPSNTDVLVLPDPTGYRLLFSVNDGEKTEPSLSYLAKWTRRFCQQHPASPNPPQVLSPMLEHLIGRRLKEPDCEPVIRSISHYLRGHGNVKRLFKFVRVVHQAALEAEPASHILQIQPAGTGSESYGAPTLPFPPGPMGVIAIRLALMHTGLGNESKESPLQERATEEVVRSLILQSHTYVNRNNNRMPKRMREEFTKVAAAIREDVVTSNVPEGLEHGRMLEAYALLKVLCRAGDDGAYTWVLPNFRYADDTGDQYAGECDMFSLSLEGEDIVIDLWACTVQTDNAKRRSDMNKLSALGELIQNRCPSVHVHNDNWFRMQDGEISERYRGSRYTAWKGIE